MLQATIMRAHQYQGLLLLRCHYRRRLPNAQLIRRLRRVSTTSGKIWARNTIWQNRTRNFLTASNS